MKTTFAPTVLLLAIIGTTAGQAFEFTPLGDLPGSIFASQAFDVSADGQVVVGASSRQTGIAPFRWTSQGGMVDLGGLDRSSEGRAFAVSASGEVVAGWEVGDNGGEAFRWTPGGGMVGLGGLPGVPPGSFYSEALGVSADGNVIVGASSSSSSNPSGGLEAFYWTPSGGMVGLGDLPGGDPNANGGPFNSRAQAVSASGDVIVGTGQSDDGFEAFRWTPSGGMAGLGDLPGGDFSSRAVGVSASGDVIVGMGQSDNGIEAFRWTPSGGMVGLGDLPGGAFSSRAVGVSADGQFVVGTSNNDTGLEAFVWNQATGMLSVQELLSSAGVDLTGWALKRAAGVSANGNTIVGWGTNPDGNDEAWLATISISVAAPCDFSGDESCDITDLNELLAQGPIAGGVGVTPGLNDQFDLTGDGVIDNGDVDEWLTIAAEENGFASPYKRGDANLDGTVDGLDFILWNDSKFTSSLLWDNGDFTSDGIVDGLDYIQWNGNKFTSSDGVPAVPEPSTVVALIATLIGLAVVRRR